MAAGEATFLDPPREGVFVGEVSVGCGQHGRRRRQPDPLPFQAPVDRPLQDAAPFRAELLGEVRIALGFRDGDRERDQVKASADSSPGTSRLHPH
jgi:hypothetical protein